MASLELVQASALIHDDMMDRSDTRRGVPSVHRRFEKLHAGEGWRGSPAGFGDCAAVLLGDLALVWSDELLHGSGLPLADLARARPVFDGMRTEVTVGQYLDVLTQATADTSLERAGKVARYKAAKYTVERPLLLGAALAGAGPEVHAAYSAFGLPLGEAFQFRDDVLGVFGDPAQTGKPAGDDLREGKRTYLVASAFGALDEAGRAELDAALGDHRLDEAGVERLRAMIRDSGALAATEARIEELMTASLECIRDSEQAAALTGRGVALDATTAQRHPQRQRAQHQGEPEHQVLHRGVDETPSDDRFRVVHDDVAAGQNAVRDQLEAEDDRIRRPEHDPAHQPRPQDHKIKNQACQYAEKRGRGVRHSSPAGRRRTARTASNPRIAQTGTTRKNSTSSSGSPPPRNTPVICSGSKCQCPAAIAPRSHRTKTAATGTTVSTSRRHLRSTLTRRNGSSQSAPARQPASTATYAKCRISRL